jgi:hypothetical protein
MQSEIELMNVKIREHRSITKYMETCQKTNFHSLRAANIQVAQISAFMQTHRNFTPQNLVEMDSDESCSEEAFSSDESEMDDEEKLSSRLAKFCKS